MVYQPKDPLGYKKLLTWAQAGEIYHKTKDFTKEFLDKLKDARLIAHMNDSARSIQRNIEEGYKRATTKEYVEFLGFSRASLEELKGDFEELKREWREKIRWEGKGEKGIDKGEIRERVIRGIEGLLDLIYGEDCMMGRQIVGLEKKMTREKTLPQKEMIKKKWHKAKAADERFWKIAKERFGIVKDDKGVIRDNRGIIRDNKGIIRDNKGIIRDEKGK